MKRMILILTVFLFAAASLSAQTRLDAMAPKDARTMAMGGAFVAMSEGYQSLYGNPATFADKSVEFTAISFTPWVYVRPTTDNIATFQEISDTMTAGGADPADIIDPLSDLTVDNGFGAGMAAGIGWVGKGLGLGLVGSGEAYVRGNTLLGAVGTIDGQVSGIVGVGVPLQIGKLRFQVGGDVRPYLRMTGDIDGGDLIGIMTGTETDGVTPFSAMDLEVDIGFGLAVDLGARMDLGRMVSVGIAIRDISTKQTFTQSTLGDAFADGGLPEGTSLEYPVYPNITLGASVRPIPDALRRIVDVTVIAEIQDPVKVAQDKSSAWNLFHLGAEADMLGGLFALRMGLNKGWISLGAGFDLLFLEMNVAVFTEELGPRPGDKPRTGISLETAIRF